MHIKKLRIKNFKCVKELETDNLKPITGIWGINGAGKSSIIQALVLMKHLCFYQKSKAEDAVRLTLDNPEIKFYNILDITYKFEPKNPIEIALKSYEEKENTLTLSTLEDSSWKFEFPEYYNKTRYFPPWRRIKHRTSSVMGELKRDFVEHDNLIHNYIHWFIHSKNEVIKFNKWATKLGYGPIGDKKVDVDNLMGIYKDQQLAIDVPIIHGGFGGNSFLSILLESYSFKNGILLIEEPEISLHYGAQSEILDFFIEMAKERNHQIIFTSHSEYLLKKIIRYFHEKRIDDTLIDLIYATKKLEGTQIQKFDYNILVERFEKNEQLSYELHRRFD